jgi:hypothetical protein
MPNTNSIKKILKINDWLVIIMTCPVGQVKQTFYLPDRSGYLLRAVLNVYP